MMLLEICNLSCKSCVTGSNELNVTTKFYFLLQGDSEVQRTMLELLNQLDGFEATKNIKVVMATNRIDILDSALLRPGRIDRKIEFPPPNEEVRQLILTFALFIFGVIRSQSPSQSSVFCFVLFVVTLSTLEHVKIFLLSFFVSSNTHKQDQCFFV